MSAQHLAPETCFIATSRLEETGDRSRRWLRPALESELPGDFAAGGYKVEGAKGLCCKDSFRGILQQVAIGVEVSKDLC